MNAPITVVCRHCRARLTLSQDRFLPDQLRGHLMTHRTFLPEHVKKVARLVDVLAFRGDEPSDQQSLERRAIELLDTFLSEGAPSYNV